MFRLGSFNPQGSFPRNSETKWCFSSFFYSYLNTADIKIVRPRLCYSNILNTPYWHYRRPLKVIVFLGMDKWCFRRSNFTQVITDHENSQQHFNSVLSEQNWLQGNTADNNLETVNNNYISFWRNVLHYLINVLLLRRHAIYL